MCTVTLHRTYIALKLAALTFEDSVYSAWKNTSAGNRHSRWRLNVNLNAKPKPKPKPETGIHVGAGTSQPSPVGEIYTPSANLTLGTRCQKLLFTTAVPITKLRV